ncbi:MAG: hypothetical protein O9292_16715 [Rhodobacteraceae bacterium]|jgi:hypothetical protein|nr:hypothetical protein [Paracoccaceae bacterium]MCZ8154022.1 hypothetical protein [Paracoccaceae bacterium]MCZ8335051.1 hypothetical protein [Paracoccaceae bacterium]
MSSITKGYRGLSIIMVVNADRIFTLATMAAGLLAGAFLGAQLLGH